MFKADGTFNFPTKKTQEEKPFVMDKTLNTKDIAILPTIKEEYISQAETHFATNDKLQFYTDYPIMNYPKSEIKKVYFKVVGSNYVDYVADLVDITSTNYPHLRLANSQNTLGKYYYIFKNLRQLSVSIPITKIKYAKTKNYLRNDYMGVPMVQL